MPKIHKVSTSALRPLHPLVLAGLFCSLSCAADYDAGAEAARRGDYASALKEWQASADQGDARAQSALGQMYLKAKGVPNDDKKALELFRSAAAQGNAMGEVYLAKMYELGRGVAADPGEAVSWYRKAAEQGNDAEIGRASCRERV